MAANLLDRSTAFDNIAYPLKYSGMKRAEIIARANELPEPIDLTDKKDVCPSQLSGGQNQNHQDIVNACVIVMLVVAYILQTIGSPLARRITNRGLFHKGGNR